VSVPGARGEEDPAWKKLKGTEGGGGPTTCGSKDKALLREVRRPVVVKLLEDHSRWDGSTPASARPGQKGVNTGSRNLLEQGGVFAKKEKKPAPSPGRKGRG